MDKKYLKSTLIAYSIIAIFCTLMVGGIGYFFWKSQLFSAESIVYKYQASGRIQKLDPKVVSKKLSSLVNSGQTENLLNWSKTVKKDIDAINHQFPEEELDGPLMASLSQFDSSVKSLKTSTSLRKLYLIFDRKVRNFRTFVKTNNWRTLTRMSGRIVARLSAVRLNKVDSFANAVKVTGQELTVMRNVTESSVLSRQDKSRILIKLNSLNTEIKLFKKYLSRHQKLQKSSKAFIPALEKWYELKGPSISKSLLMVENNSKLLAFAILAGVLFCLTALTIGFFWIRKTLQSMLGKMGQDMVKIIQRDILSSSPKLNGIVDPNTKRDLLKLNEYTQRRLKFGNYLKDGLPFGSVMIDSNFKAVWANDQFCDDWGINSSDITNDMVSWDFLIRSTNLEESDPIKEAIYEGLGGIFQINLKKKRGEAGVPYEMYVSPIDDEGDRNVLVYFYNLSSQVDTIHDQATGIIAPIKNLVQYYFSGQKDAKVLSSIRNDFECSGISSLYDLFSKKFEQQIIHRTNLLSQIDELEMLVQDKTKLIHDLRIHQEQQNEEYVEFMNTLSNLKNGVIKLFDVFGNYHSVSREFGALLAEIHEMAGLKADRAGKLEQQFDEVYRALPNVDDFKSKMAEIKTQMDLAKGRTVESFEQTLSFAYSHNGEARELGASLEKVKRNLKDFFKHWEQSEKSFSSLEVRLSKSKIIFEDSQTVIHSQEHTRLDSENFSKRVEEVRTKLDQLGQSSESIEGDIVEGFKALYTTIRVFLEGGHVINSLAEGQEYNPKVREERQVEL